MLRSLLLAMFFAGFASAPFSIAQDTPQSPFDLARGLRENDQPDLALEYLDDLARTALDGEIQKQLPVERAKARIKLAALETDEVKRDQLVSDSKVELDQFLKANASHPRAAEAAMALAGVASLQGKAQLSRAGRIPDIAGQKAAAAIARPYFLDASTRYQQAATNLENALKQADTPSLKRDRTRELYQTILDQGINRYYLGESYISAEGPAEVKSRFEAYKSAQDVFAKLGERDPTHPLCWVARAWAGECSYPMSEPKKADDAFNKIKNDAAKNPNGPGLAGVRQARFFEIRDKWIQAGKTNTAPAFSKVRQMCDSWLADYRTFRVTTETYAITFYAATTKLDEARLGVKVDPKTMKIDVNPNVRPLLEDADKDFRRLADTENEYTSRAAKYRPQVIRLLVGNAEKKPAEYATFQECHLASLVQLDKFQQVSRDEKSTPEQKKEQLEKVIGLLEREKQLPVPADSLRDSLNSQVMLVYTYRIADQPYQAAILGESIAKNGKGPTAAKAGLNALLAYREAAERIDPSDTPEKQVDLNRALAVANYLDRAIPDDASTDEARMQGARLLLEQLKYIEAFNLLTRITARYPGITRARLLEGGIAYELLRPRAAGTTPVKYALPLDAQKPAIFKTAIADLGKVPVANPASPPNVAVEYCKLQMQLAQLYLASGKANYPLAEKTIIDLLALMPSLATLPAPEKQSLPLEAENIRVSATYAQAMPLHQDKKFKESADRYQGMINAMAAAGPASKKDGLLPTSQAPAKTLDTNRINYIVIPALNSRVGEGNLQEAGKLLDILGKFGGDQNQTVNAVFQVVMATKPQIEQLRKDGKKEDAAKLSANLAQLAVRIGGADAKLNAIQLLDLGKIFKELGDYDKGVALLLRIPAPSNAAFLVAEPPLPPAAEATDAADVKKKKDDAIAAWNADKAATPYYRVAQLELLRTYRLANQLPKAEELLGTIMGKEPKRAWGATFPDFRREEFYYLEAKAASTANLPEAQKLWLEAKKGWENFGREYYAVWIKPIPANAKEDVVAKIRQQKEFVKPIYFDLQYETLRCTAKLQMHLLAAKKPDLDKGLNTIAKQIVEIEKKNPDLKEDLKTKYRNLFEDVPQLRDAYKAAGGEWLNSPK